MKNMLHKWIQAYFDKHLLQYQLKMIIRIKDDVICSLVQFSSSIWRHRTFPIKTSKHGVYLNNILKFSSYLKENTTRLHYKDTFANAV
jgi:hypothetical protein